jgi:hypothetical protein
MNMREEIELLQDLKEELLEHQSKFLNLTGDILHADHQRMYATDLLSVAVINRAMQLNSGFSLLVQDNNYLCAIPLIRLQLDNALRFYAFYLVDDSNKLFDHFSSGKPICNFRGRNNQMLSDNYLATNLDKLFPGVLDTYRNTSSHIHLSDQHLFATRQKKTNPKQPLKIAVGANTDPFTTEHKFNFLRTMKQVNQIVLFLLGQWCSEKQAKSPL